VFQPSIGRKTSELEGEVLVGSFPGIYVIGNKIKSTKVARFNLAAEFREKTVNTLYIFFTVLKNNEKELKNSEEIIYFLHCFLFSSLFLTFYDLYLLFFRVF
jgi:hypothetical protein